MNLPDWLQDEITLRAEADRLAEEKDRLTRRAGYDNWAALYGAPMVIIRSLELTTVCQDCGLPYFIAGGHNCPGSRSSLNLLRKEPVR